MRLLCSYVRILFFFLLLINNSLASAQKKTNKTLYIVEENTRIPIPEASVRTADNKYFTSSDANGQVNISNAFIGSDLITISRIGYAAAEINLSDSNFLDKELWITLKPAVSSLKEVSVRAGVKGGIFKTISELDIHMRPIYNAQEVLRIVPGLFIGQHAGGGKAEQLFLRGFDLDHGTDIQLNVDGIPVNMVSHAHGQGYADLHFVIPEFIEKVQFNKGPYFVDKGNFATAGYVDFSTKKFLRNDFIKVEAGQFNTLRSVVGVNLLRQNKKRRTRSLYFGSEAMYTRGYFDSPQDFNRFNGILKYHSELNETNSLTTMITAFSSEWKASGQIPERKIDDGTIGFYGAIDDTEGGKTSRYNALIEWKHEFTGGGSVTTNTFLTRYNFELYSNFTFYKEDTVNGDQIKQRENRWLTGFTTRFEKKINIGIISSYRSVGIQLRYDGIDNLELSGTVNRKITTRPLTLGKVNELNSGIYWTEKLMVSENFDITSSIRLDYFSNQYSDQLHSKNQKTNSTIISPKLNFSFRPGKKLEIYLYTGKGFHSNDTRVAVQQNGKKVVPPAWGADFGMIVKPFDKLIIQSAAWYLWLDQEFVYVGDEAVVEAGGQSQRMGIDLSARYELLRFLYADLDLNLTHPRMKGMPKEESYLPLAPVFTSAGGFTYRKTNGLNGSIRYRYMHRRPANEDYSIVAKGYFILDAAAHYTKPKWETGFTIQNLLNTKWKETQFNTESRLKEEPAPVSEIHFTPGTPFAIRLSIALFF